jgi:radical SAM protein with 4Fe4S-binding SPASM domain
LAIFWIDNFRKVWEEEFDIFRSKGWLNSTICNDCEYIKECKGGSIHLWELGDKKAEILLCERFRVRLRYTGFT